MIEKFQLIFFTLQGPNFYAFLKRFSYTINRKAIRDWSSFAQQIMDGNPDDYILSVRFYELKDDEVFYNIF